MIKREAVYLGTPRQFVTAAEVYGWELYGQGIERQMGTRYGVDEEMHMGGQWLPSETREPVLAFVDLRGLGHIMAQQIGDGRTRLVCFCEQDAAWRFVEPWWLDLVAELGRLGSIDAAPAVIGDGATEKRKPGPSAPSLEVQLKLWNGWLQAKGKTRQTAYCETRNPPITPKTLRNYRDNLKREKMIE